MNGHAAAASSMKTTENGTAASLISAVTVTGSEATKQANGNNGKSEHKKVSNGNGTNPIPLTIADLKCKESLPPFIRVSRKLGRKTLAEQSSELKCHEKMPDLVDLVAIHGAPKIPFLPSIITSVSYNAVVEAFAHLPPDTNHPQGAWRPPPLLSRLLQKLPPRYTSPQQSSPGSDKVQPKKARRTAKKSRGKEDVYTRIKKLGVPDWPLAQALLAYDWGADTELGLGKSSGSPCWNRLLLRLGAGKCDFGLHGRRHWKDIKLAQVSPADFLETMNVVTKQALDELGPPPLDFYARQEESANSESDGNSVARKLAVKVARFYDQEKKNSELNREPYELLSAKDMKNKLMKLSGDVDAVSRRKELLERKGTKTAKTAEQRPVEGWKAQLQELMKEESETQCGEAAKGSKPIQRP